jgi:hypothetical protein
MQNLREYSYKIGGVFNFGVLAILALSTAAMVYGCVVNGVNYLRKSDTTVIKNSDIERDVSYLEELVSNTQN